MGNKKGLSAFTSFIIAIIIIIPILVVITIIFVYGASSISSLVSSPQAYVSQTMAAINTGESVIVGSLSPSLDGNNGQFMAQFYGNSGCITLLDQLSRNGLVSAPNDPSTLSGKYFVCTGSLNSKGITSDNSWSFLPGNGAGEGAASFPGWFLAAQFLNAANSQNSSGINGSHGTLSYYEGVDPQVALGQACISFFNATTAYGRNTPSSYITSLDCVAEGESSGVPVFMSVKNSQCQSNSQLGCTNNPWAFLFGAPGQFALQTCSYTSGDALICSFTIN